MTVEEEEPPRLEAAPRKLGGPPKREFKEGERVALSLRMTPALKQQLDAAAERGGRSQSQEAEFRLERSFDRQGLLEEVLVLTYGPRMAGLLMLLARTMMLAATFQGPRDLPRYDWMADAHTFAIALEAAAELIDAIYALGVPLEAHAQSQNLQIVTLVTDMACLAGSPKYAKRTLPTESGAFRDELDTIRRLIGRDITSRLANMPRRGKGEARRLRRRRPATSSQIAQAIVDAVFALVTSTPSAPTRDEIEGIVLAQLKIHRGASKGNG